MRRATARLACGLAPLLILLLLVGVARTEEEPVLRPDRLTVKGPDGAPLAGALLSSVRATHADRPLFDARAAVHARADARGVFDALPSEAEVPGRLVVWAPGHVALPVPATAFAAEVTLAEAETIEGAVRFAQGAPAAGVVIYAVPQGDETALAHRERTTAEGRYRFGALPRGRYDVFLLRSDKRLQPLGAFAAGEDIPDVLLVGSASLSGRLLDADGTRNAAAAGVTVRLEPLPGEAEGAAPREAKSDDKGVFLIGDVVPGIYRAVIRDAQWELDQERPRVDIRAGSTQQAPAWFLRRRQVVQGPIVDADGKPIGRARVTLLRHAPEDPEAEARARTQRPAQTNAKGMFRFDAVSPGEGYRLVATAEGYAPTISEPFEVKRGVATVLGPTTLRRGWSLVVRVRDDKGKGLPGVALRTVPERHPGAADEAGWESFVARATTDAEGRATLPGLPDGDVRLAVGKTGWLDRVQVVDQPLASRVREVDVLLDVANRITGKVFRSDARRPDGYLVRAIPRDGTAALEVRTDATGNFRFPTLRPVATDVEVRPLAAGRTLTLARLEGVLPGTDPHLEIELPALRTLRGLATNLDPDDPARASVFVEAPRYDAVLERYRYVTVLTQALEVDARGDGIFEIEGLPPGMYALRAVQGARDSSALAVRVGEEDLEDLRLPIPPGARIGGTVVDERDAPILGAIVHLMRVRGDGDVPERMGSRLAGSTDEGGTFVFDDVAAGLWRLEVSRDGLATSHRELRVSEGEVVIVEDITLDTGATIEGQALGADGEPFDGARISARRLDEPEPTHITRTAADGRFRLPFVQPGIWIVTLEAETGSGWRPDALIEIAGGETIAVDFAVKGRAVIEGTVTARGRRVAGALLELVHDPEDVDAPRRRYRTQTDGGGNFRWSDLVEGAYRLVLAHGSARIEERVFVDDVDRLVLDLEAREARLEGTVVTNQGARVPGARVLARELDADGRVRTDGIEASVRSGPQGTFSLTGLPVGWYTIEVTAPGYPPGVLASAEAELPGADKPVEVVLGRGGVIDLAVVDEAQRPISGARVWIEDVDGAAFHARPYATGPGGRLLLEGVPPGEVRVRVQARGFGRAPTSGVLVGEGSSQGLRVMLRRPGTLQL
ncbi:MAG: carboxypeptidase-like regulatory domain-containing protein, partial [Planctomycetota bacterium]|nr:carboxypeptidase-like regulatory domain-containing protein [Planctomycetota bacterium]